MSFQTAVSVAIIAVLLDVVAVAVALCWAYGGYPPPGQRRRRAVVERVLLAVHVLAVLVLTEIGALVQWGPRPVWLVLALVPVVPLVLHPPIVRAARRYTAGLRVATDIAIATGVITSYAAIVMWPMDLATEDIRWMLFTAGFAAVLVGAAVSSARRPRQVAPRQSAPRYVAPRSALRRRRRPSKYSRKIGPPPPPGDAGRARGGVGSNAWAHQSMSKARCRSCGKTGYDVVTFAPSTPKWWYLGRCRSCGEQRDFYFPTAK